MNREEFHAITDIVEAVYCEQKLVFDRTKGRAAPLHVQIKAKVGTIEHYRFEAEGHARQAIDRRCYIATHIFGPDAPETDACRLWRDRVLSRSPFGRSIIRAYYLVSPVLVAVFGKSNSANKLARKLLHHFLRRVAGGEVL